MRSDRHIERPGICEHGTVSPDDYTPHSGDRRYRVEHYDLTIDYRLGTNRLDGVVVVRGRAVDGASGLFGGDGDPPSRIFLTRRRPQRGCRCCWST